jgi:DNA-binding NarL/FixJ family response regulator
MKKKIVLVEDNEPYKKQLMEILNDTEDIECLFAVSSAEEAIKKIPGSNPDVILMDINLPGMSGIDCLPALRRKIPEVEILMLTAYEEDDNIFRALKSGASGYILKSSHAQEIFDAIRQVHAGGSSFSSHIARKVVQFFRNEKQIESDNEKLSAREHKTLELFATGYTYKEVANQMNVTVETIRTYVKRVCTKLHVRNRVEAIIKYRS